MKIAFFKLESWKKKYLQGHFKNHQLLFFDRPLDQDNIPQEQNFDIASVFIDSEVDKQTLDTLPKLKFIVTRSTGFDHIDLKACASRGVLVSNIPPYGENTVAEFTFGLILCLTRKIFRAYDQIRESGSFSLKGLRGIDLKDKTLGVIGVGRIGRRVIKIARGFEMKVVAYTRNPDQKLSQKLGFSCFPFEKVLKSADILTLHVPLTKETHHLINKDNISLIKKGAYLINTSRGEVVDTEALVMALEKKILAGAALDVLEEEGVARDELGFFLKDSSQECNLRTALANRVLIDMDNVIVTPHNAFNTIEALRRILEISLENIEAFIKGKPINLVKQ